MSTAPRYLPHYTVADHAAWEGDFELLQGVAVAMTPSPFGPHAERLSRVAAAFWNAIDASGCRATVLAEIDWIVTNDTVVRPDLVVVCGPTPQRHGAAATCCEFAILRRGVTLSPASGRRR
ncbi:MAG: Uma2 family endonuclease [Planctomycetia bacterium]|nr:Uma2 family endonuclease [Planctomycetia bacterium]